jgi:hypothetical protein
MNTYWPIYNSLEKQFLELTFYIHIDDNQLNTYSIKISELLLRAAIEIESISKELYLRNGGPETKNIKYDEDALKLLNGLWKLDKKILIQSSSNIFTTRNIISPFLKEAKRNNGGRTYSWNNAYKNIKHNRAGSLENACIKYLIEILGALYILNLYYKDETFDLGNDNARINFSSKINSELFSVNYHKPKSYDGWIFGKNDDFDTCVYIEKMTDDSIEIDKKNFKKSLLKRTEIFKKHPNFELAKKNFGFNDSAVIISNDIMEKYLTKEEYIDLFLKTEYDYLKFRNIKYEAVLNKHNIKTDNKIF